MALAYTLVAACSSSSGCDGATIVADASAGDGAVTIDSSIGDSSVAYNGTLDYVICDIKRPLAQQGSPVLSTANLNAVLDGLKSQLGCNAVRFYIDPSLADQTAYPSIYVAAFNYVRATLGLKIYANPLATGDFGKTDADYASFVVAYANYFKPEFLGPFNESGQGATTIQNIAAKVKVGLSYAPLLVGPDAQHVETSLGLVSTPGVSKSFDIFGSHNAVDDEGATAAAWTELASEAGIPTWSTENPQPWTDLNEAGVEIGVKAVVDAPIRAVVLYLSFPDDLSDDGGLTTKGQQIAAGLLR